MYDAYRRRQARGLVSMLPRQAIRPLYRAAIAGRRAGEEPSSDPLETLVAHCATLLPLPPYAVWAADFARYADAHFRDLDDWVEGPTPATPVTLANRSLIVGDGRWTAALRVFRAEGAWRGYIAFEGPSAGDSCRTAEIFRETTPEELKESFAAFDSAALGAFLRSSLP
jgi:hypothetical protein